MSLFQAGDERKNSELNIIIHESAREIIKMHTNNTTNDIHGNHS